MVAYTNELPMNQQKAEIKSHCFASFPLFIRVLGIGILRTSPFGDSPKLNFAFTEFSEVGEESCKK